MMLFLLKAAIVLSILLLFYKLFLQKESFFRVNRWYLLMGFMVTFVLPIVTLPALINHQGIVDRVVSETTTSVSNEPSVKNSQILSADFPKSENNVVADRPTLVNGKKGVIYWMSLLYFFGLALLSLNFLTQLLGIFLKINKSKDRLKDGRCIILNQPEENEPCSFFNYIFISSNKYDKNTYEQIIAHEKVHVRKYHSIDILLAELAIIILWFNPLVWLYRNEVEKNIEYQTDAFLLATKKVVPQDYQMNLISIASHKKANTLISNYNQSLIKKRIIMMNKQRSNGNSYWKYAFIIPTLVITLLVLNRPYTVQSQEPTEASYNAIVGENEYDNELNDDYIPLLRAARQGNQSMVKKMLENGSNVNLVQQGEGTPLTSAIRGEEFKMAQFLLDKGADPNFGTASDGYPLWIAVRKGDIALVRMLITKGADVNMKFPGDGSALIQACKMGHFEIMKLLVESGANIDMPVDGDGNPLIMAARGGHSKIIEYLVRKGADINYEVVGDEVPLIAASEQGHLSTVKFLVENGADVNKVCKEEIQDGSIRIRTALIIAKQKGHKKVVTYLKSKGATR